MNTKKMQLVISCQTMINKIDRSNYQYLPTWIRLSNMTEEELRAEQERLIPLYNECVKKEKEYQVQGGNALFEKPDLTIAVGKPNKKEKEAING